MASQFIHSLIDEQAILQLNARAIDSYDGSFSFGQLCEASLKLSHHLVHMGVRREDRVAILMEASAFYTLSIIAVLKSAAIFVPLDPTHPRKRLQQLIRDIDPILIITSTTSRKVANNLHDDVLVVDRAHTTWENPPPRTAPVLKPGNAAYIIFTSGSTGNPKGVLVEHGAFLTSALARGRLTGLAPGSRVLQYAAHTFDVSIDEILTTLIHGGCVCVPSEADRFLLAPAINNLGVNHALLTPTSAKLLRPDDVPGLDTLQLGGELLTEELIAVWSSRVRLFNVYGPAEASVACIMLEKTFRDDPGGVIGFPVGSICRIVDPDDHNRLLSSGDIGELVIGGRLLAREYWKDSMKTAASFIQCPSWAVSIPGSGSVRFYKTGDLAQMDENGLMTINGRKDNQIKVRGQRINVEEVESALLSTDLVQSIVVLLPKKGPLVSKLTAVVVTTSSDSFANTSPTSAQQYYSSEARALDENLQTNLYHEVQNSITTAMIPSRWIQLPHLPRNTSAKTDRKAVQAWVEEMDASTFQSIARSSISDSGNSSNRDRRSLEPRYGKTLCQVLGIDITQLKPDASFIRNGGDSISAMELCRLGKEAGMSFWIRDILSTCSLRELFRASATRFEKKLVGNDRPGASFPMSPVQQFFFNVTGSGDHTFTQSVDLEPKERILFPNLKRAVDELVSMHPMLRARFNRDTGTWMQCVSSAAEDSYSITAHQTGGRSPFTGGLAPPSLSITCGPVFHVRFWESSTGSQWLQLAAHHLVIDLVSWRIILHDLSKSLRGTPLSGSSSISFQAWCSLQREYAKTLSPGHVLPIPIIPNNNPYWCPQGTPLQNTHGRTACLQFTVDRSSTARVIDSRRDVKPIETMIGSFYKAFSDTFSDRETPTIFVESHGREPWHPDIDISETVGWFTTAYPIHVPASRATDLRSAIIHTMQRRRSVPANGHPFWCQRYLGRQPPGKRETDSPMEFVFNFAGQFQQIHREDSPFRVLSTVGDETADPDAQRLSLFDIFVSHEDGELQFTITFPSEVAHRTKLGDLARTWKSALQSRGPDGVGFNLSALTLSDYPEDVSSVMRRSGIHPRDDIPAVYWASDLQQHMLCSQAQDPTYYRVMGTWRLRSIAKGGEVNVDRLQDAWDQVVSNYASLRTVFVRDDTTGCYLAVVLRDAPRTRVSKRCAGQAPADTNETAELLPPYRLIIKESDEHGTCFSLELSHAIMDATSRSILLEGLLDAYTAQPMLQDASSYGAYLQARALHQAAQDASSFPSCIFPTGIVATATNPDAVSSLALPAGLYATMMASVCSTAGVTVPTAVFAAWSLVLSKFTAKADISFAYVASGRSANVSGIEKSVGLYIDLSILTVNVKAHTFLWNLAKEIQHASVKSILGGTSFPIPASRNPHNGRMDGEINTMVNVRSAGVDSIELRRGGLELSMLSFQDPWDVSSRHSRGLRTALYPFHTFTIVLTRMQYDLVISVDIWPGNKVSCSIDYRSSTISRRTAAAVAKALALTLDALLENQELTIRDWEELLRDS